LQVINGIIKLPKAKTETGSNQRHGDSAISKALAYFASRNGASEIEYAATGQRVSAEEKAIYTDRGFGAVAGGNDFSGF
jgi:phage FluMu gp28-like protein